MTDMHWNKNQQGYYKVAFKCPPKPNTSHWWSQYKTVACCGVEDAIRIIKEHHSEAVILAVAHHGQIDYHDTAMTL